MANDQQRVRVSTEPRGPRPAVGDFLDKPVAQGGLAFSRPLATLVLAAAIVALIVLVPQRPGKARLNR